MNKYKEIEGNLITLAKLGEFDVIAHGCNCFCSMESGIAVQMAKEFGVNQYSLESSSCKGDINKLGQIEWLRNGSILSVVNAYTQYKYGKNHTDGISKPLDYEALTLCMRKINRVFKGEHIGLPQIGAGLGGGDWNKIKEIIKTELKDCMVTVVIFKK